MSLLNLLSVGRSLVGAGDEAPRYQMADKGLLPNFGSKARYSCPVPEEKEAIQQPDASRALRQQELPVSPEIVKRDEKPIFAAPVAAKQAVPFTAPPPMPAAPVPAKRGLKQFFAKILGRKKAEKISRPNTFVQGELSLEAVRVVRNDLSDADVELVSPAQQSAANNKMAAFPGKGTRWTELTAKLFETGRSRLS